jgi:hypothetical protein
MQVVVSSRDVCGHQSQAQEGLRVVAGPMSGCWYKYRHGRQVDMSGPKIAAPKLQTAACTCMVCRKLQLHGGDM